MDSETIEKHTLNLQEDSTQAKIRTLYMDGHNMYEIAEILEIPKGTIDSAFYRNTHNFRTFMVELKKERMLRNVERVSDEIIAMDTTENAKMLAIKQKEAEFIRETLLKDHGYSKRIETVGLNINKNEPLDPEQKAKLDKIIKKSFNTDIKDVEFVNSTSENGSTEQSN